MRLFTILLIFVFNVACTESTMTDLTIDKEDPIPLENSNYLALGDSYTIGESVPESDRFPVILSHKLNDLGMQFDTPRIIARTGWTTDELAAAIAQENITDTFDLVTLLIGVNNQYRGRAVENFRSEYKDLLQQSIAFAGGIIENVIVVSIPDWGVSPFGASRDREKIAAEIDLYNQVKKEETEKIGVQFVNITEISRTALGDETLFAQDGLHFSGKMHELWVDEIIEQCFE